MRDRGRDRDRDRDRRVTWTAFAILAMFQTLVTNKPLFQMNDIDAMHRTVGMGKRDNSKLAELRTL